MTYPYGPFDWAVQQEAEKGALRLWCIVHPVPADNARFPPAPDVVLTEVLRSSHVDQRPGVLACFRRPNEPQIQRVQ
jgi:hypothetical protein